MSQYQGAFAALQTTLLSFEVTPILIPMMCSLLPKQLFRFYLTFHVNFTSSRFLKLKYYESQKISVILSNMIPLFSFRGDPC